MTEVIVSREAKLITKIIVKDHAGFTNHGSDIVCAGISAITFGILNSLVEYGINENDISIDDTIVSINFNIKSDIQLIGEVMLIQLQTIQEGYPNYINII